MTQSMQAYVQIFVIAHSLKCQFAPIRECMKMINAGKRVRKRGEGHACLNFCSKECCLYLLCKQRRMFELFLIPDLNIFMFSGVKILHCSNPSS